MEVGWIRSHTAKSDKEVVANIKLKLLNLSSQINWS